MLGNVADLAAPHFPSSATPPAKMLVTEEYTPTTRRQVEDLVVRLCTPAASSSSNSSSGSSSSSISISSISTGTTTIAAGALGDGSIGDGTYSRVARSDDKKTGGATGDGAAQMPPPPPSTAAAATVAAVTAASAIPWATLRATLRASLKRAKFQQQRGDVFVLKRSPFCTVELLVGGRVGGFVRSWCVLAR